MGIKIAKCEARNAVDIRNIGKVRNKAVGDFKLMDASHNLFRGSIITIGGHGVIFIKGG